MKNDVIPLPNVILIMLDSLRRDHVGCYGNNWIRTPNIDALAREGVRFVNAYPEALPTLPVRRAMHTGMRTFPCRDYTPTKGDVVLIPGWQPIPEEQVTMAEVFRHNGYLTAHFASTYHMFKPSMNFHRGFKVWEWIRGQESDRYKIPFKGDIEDPTNLPCDLAYGCVGHSLKHCLANMQDWRTEADWFPAKTFGKAARWLEQYGKDGPFLLVIDEFDPHEPWNAPRNILDLYFDTASYKGRRIINTHGGAYEFREGELEYTLAQYAGEVTLCDKYVGMLLKKAKELDLWEDTIVALVSDHGHNIMDHGVIHKMPDHMYPELMDLVYMIRGPDGEAASSMCDAYVAHHDIPVTLMSMAGIDSPSNLDGENVWAWATGDELQTRDHATCMFYPWLWYRDGDHAYMSYLDGTQEKLYDLKHDPEQMTNIADDNRQVCKAINGRLWAEMGGDPPQYEIMREGHEWYEYPDLYDPTSDASRKLLEKRRKGS
jgi:arylsulfatase A-like enzyme